MVTPSLAGFVPFTQLVTNCERTVVIRYGAIIDGSDSVSGGALVDYIYLYSDGHDTVDGGDGYDYVYLYNYAQSAVVADLAAGTLQGGDASGGGSATIVNVEGLSAAAFDDVIRGKRRGQLPRREPWRRHGIRRRRERHDLWRLVRRGLG